MILISHRGNINGKILELENKPDYISKAISLGYHVEIDLWMKDKLLYLGHDEPQYLINDSWLTQFFYKLWIHCKNPEAIIYLQENYPQLNYFWHQEDTLTLTSKKYLWVYPGKQPIKNSIAVMPEIFNDDTSQCVGICSDYIQKYKK
jgi:hypothetical protein